MKVLLINPPLDHVVLDKGLSLIEEQRGHSPPLGLLYVAAALEQWGQCEVRVLDAQVEGVQGEVLQEQIREFAPGIVGLTAMTLTMPSVLAVLRMVKQAVPGCCTVLGGPHVHLYPEETVSLADVDLLVLGEGERSIVKVVKHLGDAAALERVPGLVFKDGGRVVRTGPPEPIMDLDALAFPARHLTPVQSYSSILGSGSHLTTIVTSRGCPFACTFCSRPHLGKRFRARSAHGVADEIEACVGLGIQEFLVYDDTFTVNRERVLAICEEIQRRALRIKFDVRARLDTVDDEVLDALAAAGCQAIHYGVEAGSQRVLDVLQKNITIDLAKRIFGMTRRRGIRTLGYFMIGNPGETQEEILLTFRVMRELSPDYAHLTVLIPFPGTQVYEMALEKGIIGKDVWREFAAAPHEDFSLPHWNEHFTKAQLDEWVKTGYRRFYLRPGYVLRRLTRIRSWRELGRHIRAGLGLLRLK